MSADNQIVIEEVAPNEFIFKEAYGLTSNASPIKWEPLNRRITGIRQAVKLVQAVMQTYTVEYGYIFKFLPETSTW